MIPPELLGLETPRERTKNRRESTKSKVDEEVANAILIGLSHFGSETVVESIVYLLELEHSVDIYSIARDPAPLKAALYQMFGGASFAVEAKICQALGKKLGIESKGMSMENLISMLVAKGIESAGQRAR